MTTEDYKNIAAGLAQQPGIYKFLDKANAILYVGKAKNIKKRLASYFGDKKHRSHKTKALVKNADHIDFTVVETEQDALLLESTLIKKYQPRYNVMLKDGKSYAYICIKKERFPRVIFTRTVHRDGSVYFGPYTSKWRASQLLELIRQLFQLRTCNFVLSEENIKKGKFKVCLEYHIKNCLGPCEGLEDEASYNEKINQVKNILRGNFKLVKDYINEQMAKYAENLAFEKAQFYKEKLSIFEDYQSKSTVVSTAIQDVDVFSIVVEEKLAFVNYLKVVDGVLVSAETVELEINLNENKKDLLRYSVHNLRERYHSIAPELILPFRIKSTDEKIKIVVPQRGDKKKLLELSEKNVKYFILHKRKQEASYAKKQSSFERILATLQADLHMKSTPYHIECFDNSNIQGTNPASSCVVFKNAKPSKRDYRHFKIKTVVGPDDFASMEEVVYRRYKRLLDKKENIPQLIIIDGGKGQLSSAVKSLEALGILSEVTVIGIAKRLEEIFFANDPVPLLINKKSESLKLIQQARNEAHRFAINLHRDLRSKNFLKTELTEIKGIGTKTSEKLLKHFGSVEKLKNANVDDIKTLVGPSIFEKLKAHFPGIASVSISETK